MAYAPPTLIGYNANPPEDDGSEISTNEITWAGIKEKIGDPLKAYIDATQAAITAEFTSVGTPTGILLTSGTVSAAATKDIVLTSYTAYRAIKFVLTGFTPASADDYLLMRVSYDGGSNFVSTGKYMYTGVQNDAQTPAVTDWTDAADDHWYISSVVGTGTFDSVSAEITIYEPDANLYALVDWASASVASTGYVHMIKASGRTIDVSTVNAVRFFFLSSNIERGSYAVYGLN